MDDFTKLQNIRQKKDLEKDKKYKEDSKERLRKICSTKIRTTMIGALESIEKRLTNYFNTSNEGLLLKKIYEEMRQEILDRGNQQIRNLDTEFEQYIIEWKRYTLQLPIRRDING